MSKKRKTRKKQHAFPAAPSPAHGTQNPVDVYGRRPMRWDLVIVFLVIAIGGTYLAIWLRPGSGVPRYTYEVLREYPHDPKAFTQGLVWDNGFIWESTGRYGESSVRKVDLESGDIILNVGLPEKQFGEGLTVWQDRLYQLTWKSGIANVYDMDLNKVQEHRYVGHAWGLTHYENELIMSDGTATIKFIAPDSFEEIRRIRVRDGHRTVSQLNELEYVNGSIYANQWQTDLIYEIDPATGDVTAIIDLSGIWPTRNRPQEGLLNGIAFNPKTKKLLVTGKLCPQIFEIDLKLIE